MSSDFVIEESTLKEYKGKDMEVIIPEGVTEIGSRAFENRAKIESITLPDSVTEIGSSAFKGCKKLKSITIPESITCCSNKIFEDCASLKSIVIPESVTEIGESAFSGCKNLESITIPDSVKVIGDEAFAGCESLESITIPDGVTEIGYYAFSGCKSLKSIIMPDSVTEIEDHAFYGCYKLKDVNLPRSIKKIGDGYSKVFSKKPEWLSETSNKFNAGIADLIRKKWINQMTVKDWANLYFTQTIKPFKELFKKYMADKPNDYLSAMIEILKERGKAAMFTRAAEYAVEYNRELDGNLIGSLYESAKSAKGTKKVLEILEPIVNIKEIDKESPYARLYEKFDEPQLLKHYKEHKGNLELLETVKLKDGSGTAPQIAVLAAVVPYLDLSDTAVKILSESDEPAGLLDHDSLMEFIKRFTGFERNNYKLYPYCRYANEQEIQNLLSMRKKEAGRNNRKYFEKYLPKDALLLSDTKTAIMELQKAEKYSYYSPLYSYAKMRGMTKDDLLDNILTDIGLDKNGIKEYDLGDFKVTASLTPELKLSLFNEQAGKEVKSIPKKGADPAKYEAAKADLADKRKALKKIVSARLNRLLENFLSAKGQNAEEWKKANLDNAINRRIAELIVWEQEGKTFTIKDKTIIDSSGKELPLTDKPIKLAHPMEMKEEDVSVWQKYFAMSNLKQPFLQIWEPVVDPETIKEDRYSGIKLPLVYFMSLDKHGITYDSYWSYDEGRDININFKGCALDYEIEAEYSYEFSKDDKIKFGEFAFKTYDRQVNHIVSLLDKWTFYERIKKDDLSVIDRMDNLTAAQLADYTNIAIENNATNLTAKLLELKKERFPEFDGMEEFTLGDW